MDKRLFILSASKTVRKLHDGELAYTQLHDAIFVPAAKYDSIINFDYYMRCFSLSHPLPEDWRVVVTEFVLHTYHAAMITQERRAYWRPNNINGVEEFIANHLYRINLALQDHGYVQLGDYGTYEGESIISIGQKVQELNPQLLVIY